MGYRSRFNLIVIVITALLLKTMALMTSLTEQIKMNGTEQSVKPNGQGIGRIIKAAQCSVKGIQAAVKHEAAFRQEFTLAAVLLPLAIYTSASIKEFVVLTSVLLLVLIVELLNSAIEATVDRIGLEHHKLAGQAKDMGSAAVLLSLLIVALVWGEHLYSWFNR